LYCRSVGAAFLISMDIVILIRCWLYWTMIWSWLDDFYYADHGLWILDLSPIPMIMLNDAWMMLWWFLLTTADHGLFYRTCQLRRSLLYDVVVMSSSTSLLMLFSFAVPPGDVVVVVVLICSVCAPVQLRADEYLLYRWWVSRLQPLTPYELYKQFVSDRWTLEDDLMILFLRCRTWLHFTLYFVMIMVIVSEHPVCLSVCHPTRCRVADVVFTQYLPCIYLVVSH